MSNKFISKGQRNVCVTFVKYYPVLMQVIMLASIFDEFYPFSITNWAVSDIRSFYIMGPISLGFFKNAQVLYMA